MFLPKIRDRADIPNTEGFKITVLLEDGSQVKTIVSKRQDGTHFLTGVKDFSKVKNWEPRS